jgi:hypothetical protein
VKKLSNNRKEWIKKYNEHHREFINLWGKGNPFPCMSCYKFFPFSKLDRHHPNGRETFDDLMDYILVCRQCHIEIHNNPRLSIDRGLLKRGIKRSNPTAHEMGSD